MPPKTSKSARLKRSHNEAASASTSSSGPVAVATPTTVDALPDEILLHIFTFVETKTMLTSMRGVCRRWRALCGGTPGMQLDLTFLDGIDSALGSHSQDGIGVRMALALARRWAHVVEIRLGESTSSDVILSALASSCPGLTAVSVLLNEGNRDMITDTGIVTLAMHCPSLAMVSFMSCDMTDVGVTTLAEQCKKLVSVIFVDCDVSHQGILAIIAKHGTSLTSVGISMSSISDVTAVAVAKACPKLTHVRMIENRSLTDVALKAFAQHCPLLRTVYFSGSTRVTDAGVCKLAENCKMLTNVDFSYCSSITSTAVIALAERCPRLSVVDFSGCLDVRNDGVSALFRMCSELTDVAFCTCLSVTGAVAVSLAFWVPKNCPRLKVLDFRSTTHSADSVASFNELRNVLRISIPSLKILDTWSQE